MQEIMFVNGGYNIAEFQNLTFKWPLSKHAFLYFQGPVIVKGKKVDSGACILYTAGTMHDYITQKGFVNSYVGFKAPVELFETLKITVNKIIYPTNCDEINEILKEMCQENTTRNIGYEEKNAALVLNLLVAISRGINRENKKAISKELNQISAIRERYLENLVDVPNIEDLALESGISKTQLYKLYTKHFHTSPKNDLTRARLEKFRNTIREEPEKKVYEVAVDCGFRDIPNFFRVFKRWYGYTPKEYATAARLERIED